MWCSAADLLRCRLQCAHRPPCKTGPILWWRCQTRGPVLQRKPLPLPGCIFWLPLGAIRWHSGLKRRMRRALWHWQSCWIPRPLHTTCKASWAAGKALPLPEPGLPARLTRTPPPCWSSPTIFWGWNTARRFCAKNAACSRCLLPVWGRRTVPMPSPASSLPAPVQCAGYGAKKKPGKACSGCRKTPTRFIRRL